jgi:hypothetical protein
VRVSFVIIREHAKLYSSSYTSHLSLLSHSHTTTTQLHRAEATEHKGPVELLSPKVEQGKWHDGRWRQSIEVNLKPSPTKQTHSPSHHHHSSSSGRVPVESSVYPSSEEQDMLDEVESLLKYHDEHKPMASSVYERLVSSLQEGGTLSSPALRGHASIQALRDRLAVVPISPSEMSRTSSRGGGNRSWLSEHSHDSSHHNSRRGESPSASSLRSSVRSISSGRLRASEELSDDLQELLDQSNAINFLQVQRGASRKTWSHGPVRKKKRRPRPAIRSTKNMTLSSTTAPAPRILKTRLVRPRVTPKPVSRPDDDHEV